MAAAEGGIKADDLIISIPRLASITLAPGARCPCPAFVAPDYWRAQPWFVQMGIMLLHEQRLGEASRLSRYIEQLPRSFDAPVLWTPQQLQQLQCPHTIQQVQLQQQEWAGLHRQLLASGLQPGQTRVTSEQFLWALCAVRSRTFSGPYIGSSLADRLRLAALVGGLSVANVVLGLADVQRTLSAALAVLLFNLLYELILSRSLKQHALCPLVDFINHSSASKSEVSLDYFSDRYSVQAGRDYSMGEEVFISYGGNQTNDSLLQYYGFTEPDLPGDCYCMTRMMAWLEAEQGPVAPWRLDALRQAGLMEAVSSVTLVRKGFPAESLHALRFLLAPDEEARNTALGGLASWQQAGSPEQEQRLALLLVAACEKEL
ncbi:SET domain-containing protein, partial [Haematococcus lacustris]